MTKTKRSEQEFRPAKKSLGQNFLVDPNYISKIVDALEIGEDETIIEIGPGRGAITEYLVESGANVVAIELDRDIVSILRQQFASSKNVSIVEADATGVDFERLLEDQKPKTKGQSQSIKLVANLPYYVSTPILQHLATQRHLFARLVLMFQKEVVDRITAKPGSSDRGFLTVLTEAAFDVEKLFDVPPNAFQPVPKVTSSVAIFRPKENKIKDEEKFRKLISMAFAQKRKTILNNLKTVYPNASDSLVRGEIDPTRRAESISLEEWQRLFLAIY